jgi:excisionase family DNA binding protein
MKRKSAVVSLRKRRHPEYVSTLEAAKILGVSTFSTQRWFDEGLLKGSRLPGGKRLISRASLDAFLKEHSLVPTPPGKTSPHDRMRVLIVEDDAKLLEVMKEALEESGRVITETATSGLDAGLAVAEFRPDAIVLDVMLEDIPGAAVVQRVRQSPLGRTVKIVAISGKASADDIREIKHAGANAFLAKPFGMRDLLRALGVPAKD